VSEFCPQCGSTRTGAFRFCRSCRFDFDGVALTAAAPPAASVAQAVTKAPMKSRLTGRQWLGSGVALVVGLAVIGNLTNAAAPVGGAQSTPAPTQVAAAAQPTPIPTPWATVNPGLAPTGPTQKAKVVRIVDGDTIVVAIGGKNFKLRYIGMDTPEDVDPNSPVEPLSREAAAANAELVGGKTVVLEMDVSETDQYDRLLRYVWLHEGATWTLVNLELVRLGFASAATYPPDVKYVDVFASAEGTARNSLVGLWGAAPTEAPTPVATPKPTARPTAKPTPRPTPRPTKKPSSCHPSYTPCLPIVGDLNCPDVRALGKAPVRVIGPDDYKLDRDGDGLGCE
jgi:micrococcal nuclease